MDNPGYHSDSVDAAAEKNDPIKKNSSSLKSNTTPDCVRSTLAQCFATFVHSLSILMVGLLLTTPTAIIGKVHKVSSGLSLSKDEVSWYACLLPACQSFGCFLSGLLQNYIGRRQGLMFTYVLAATTWVMLYRAESANLLYVSSVLAGISVGLNDAPSPAYVREIATPKLRSILLMYTVYNITVGNMAAFLLVWLTSWKTVCLICLGWVVFSVTILGFIPESPVWLIQHGRKYEAIEAFQWLRGWVPEKDVLLEFEELDKSVENSNSNNFVVENSDQLSRKQKFRSAMNNGLLEGRTLRPFFFLLCTWFFVSHGTLASVRSYAIIILDGLHLPVDSNLLACSFNLVSPIGGIWATFLVRIFGRRRALALWMVAVSSLISVFLGVYIWFQHEISLPWIYIVFYIVLGFFSLCTCNIPWILLGEIYPPDTRSTAVAVTTVVMHLCSAIYVKFYYTLQRWMATQAIYISYGVVGVVGFLYLWFFMPETEGKTVAEIGELFERDARSSCPHFREKK